MTKNIKHSLRSKFLQQNLQTWLNNMNQGRYVKRISVRSQWVLDWKNDS